eukprot:COSAG04_NODE_407_length_14863_cov_24.011244_2_plen_67_part_00
MIASMEGSRIRRLSRAAALGVTPGHLTMRVQPALAVITAIVGTAYAAEQTTDGLVQVGKMHRPCAS